MQARLFFWFLFELGRTFAFAQPSPFGLVGPGVHDRSASALLRFTRPRRICAWSVLRGCLVRRAPMSNSSHVRMPRLRTQRWIHTPNPVKDILSYWKNQQMSINALTSYLVLEIKLIIVAMAWWGWLVEHVLWATINKQADIFIRCLCLRATVVSNWIFTSCAQHFHGSIFGEKCQCGFVLLCWCQALAISAENWNRIHSFWFFHSWSRRSSFLPFTRPQFERILWDDHGLAMDGSLQTT